MRLSSIVLALCLSSAAFSTPLLCVGSCDPDHHGSHHHLKDIRETCKHFRLRSDHHTLTASCRKHDHRWVRTSIDLNRHIGVEHRDAELAWGHTKFSRHAKRIKVSGSATLHAEVKDHRGHYHHSSLELHQRIFNKNGRLVYKH